MRKLYHQTDSHSLQLEGVEESISSSMGLEQTLKELYNESQLPLMVRQLETLVHHHQDLASQSSSSPAQLREVEQRIFSILGKEQDNANQASDLIGQTLPSPPKSSITVSTLLKILNSIQDNGQMYLGAALVTHSLLESRPTQEWFEQFQIQRSQPVTFSGDTAQILDDPQKELARQWVKDSVQSCAQIITQFPEIVDLPQLLGQL